MHNRLLGLALLSGSVHGCGCPEAQDFDIDEELTAYTIDRLLQRLAESETGGEQALSADALTCEQVCNSVVSTDSVSTCTFDIDGYIPPTDNTTDASSSSSSTDTDTSSTTSAATDRNVIVGSVQCSGKYTPPCIGGRRPLGHVEARVEHADSLGRALAAFATMEAASVDAFLELQHQLERWNAPRDLIERCKRAAHDEVQHARVFTALADERGVRVPPPQRVATEDSLVDAAIHNATEGCVRETWAALLAHYQARAAGTPRLRRTYEAIASDETRHGQLAWDLHRWFLERLDAPNRRRVLDAQRSALERLPTEARAQAQSFPAELGCPAPAIAEQLARAFRAELSPPKTDDSSRPSAVESTVQ